MKRIYLDYAATTPVDKRVKKVMDDTPFGNTMSLHGFGQEAKIVLENSRQVIADFINANPEEIIFTGSASESNNLALKGVVFANKNKNHIIISSIEHPCIMESAKWLKKNGCEVTILPVDKFGMVNPDDVRNSIKENTVLVSVMHASNEIGTVQPIAEIGKICREKNVYFHTDASQTFGKIKIDVEKMNIDLLTASGHKIYGPKGAGLLYVRNGVRIEPIIHGGGQENGLRSSTVNLPAVAGFSKAVEICQKEMKSETARLKKMRDKIIKNILKIKGSHLNGPPAQAGHPEKRLSNNINAWFEFVEGESVVIQLDLEGIACSTGSACSSIKLEPSYVLMATGLRPEQAHGSLRISVGRFTTEKEIDKFLEVLPKVINKIRAISPFK